MSNDLNYCAFIGRLGRDVETRYATNGDPIANFSIAVGRQRKGQDGEKTEEVEWVRCVAFAKLAEICGEYLAKGSQVFVSGRMKTRKWQGNDGVDRYITEIIVNDMQMLARAPGDQSQDRESGETRQSPPRQQPARGRGDGGLSEMNDDVPFTVIDTYRSGQLHLRVGPEKVMWRTHAEGLLGLRRGKVC